MTAPRRFALVALGLLLASAVAVSLASQVPAVGRHLLRWAESRLTQQVGREIRVGSADFRPLRGSLDLHHVQVASGTGLADGTLLAVESIRLRWRWPPLLRRSLVLDRIVLVQPRLTLRSVDTSGPPLTQWLTRLFGTRAFRLGGWTVDIAKVEVEEGDVSWDTNGVAGSVQGVRGFIERRDEDGTISLAATMRASRLLVLLEGAVRDVTQIALRVDGTAAALSIAEAEGVVAGTRVTGKGRILDPAGAAQLDLDLSLSSPLTALLKSAGVRTEVDGLLAAEGSLRGPGASAVFQGKGTLQFPATSPTRDPIAFDLRWADGRLEIQTPPAEQPDDLWARLLLEPGTGAYRARVKVRETDLGALTGLPAMTAHLVGLALPTDLGGRLTADVDLTGRGADLATLRGYGRLRVDDLSVEPGLPTGRLEARVLATASQLALETFALDVPGGTVQGKGNVAFADGRVDVPIRADIRSVAALGRGFGLPVLGGSATLGGRLTGTRDAPRFEGYLSWREPRIAMHAADRIEGDVEWLPRTLRSPRLVVRLGQTVATLHGSIVAPGGTPLRRLDPKRDLVLDVTAEVSAGRTADLAPFLPADLPVRGAFRASGRITGTAQAPTGEVELALNNFQTWEEKWHSGNTVLRLTPDAFELARLSMRRGAEQMSGDIRVGHDGALTGRLSTTAMDLAKIGVLSGSKVAGQAKFLLDVQGTLQEPRVLAKAAADALLFRDVSFGAGTATFRVEHKALDLNLTLGAGDRRMHLNLGPPPDRDLRLDASLSDADLVPLLRLTGIDTLSSSHARGTGRVLMRGPAADFANAEGDATFDTLRLQWRGETWESRGPVEVAWRGQTATLRQARLHSRDRELDIRGTVVERDQTDLQVTARFPLTAGAGRLPFLQSAEGFGTAELRVHGSLDAPDIRGKLQIHGGQARLAGVPAAFEDLRGTVELEGERARVRDLRGRIGWGDLRATGEVSWRGDDWSVQAAFQLDESQAERLLAGFYKANGGVTGTLSLGGTLESRGRGTAGFRENLAGNLRLTMRDGHFGQQTLMVRILSLVNLGELLNPRATDISAPGIPYRRLTSDIMIERGVARTENLLVESRAFNLSAYGQVDLVHETVEIDVAVKPFQTIDRLVTKVPVVGWLLSGKEGAVIAAFYRVTGPLSDPAVTSLPLQSIGRGIFGVFRRLLQLPETITGPFEDLPPQQPKPETREGR
jgi:prepilin-type processing-associated H-X9-DG protein